MIQLLSINLLVVAGLMSLLWLISLARRDASIVDPFWGTGFVVVAWWTYSQQAAPGARALFLTVLTTVWGLRLSVFLLWRNWSHGEDRRYAAMRQHHGERFWLVSLGTVFLLQAGILWFVSLPLQLGVSLGGDREWSVIDVCGLILWLVGFCFETVGDWQLARFRANPAHQGEVCDRGLWHWTRHPNYFGDFCVWWGLYLIAAAGGAWWTILSPLLMSFFLMKVSGVKLLESTIAERRPAYRDYIARTNAFFPGPPRC